MNTEWQRQNRDKRLQRVKTRRAELRIIVFEAYGNKCACCGESTKEFLTVDHVNNDGARHRKELKSTSTSHLYRHIIKLGFPSHFRLLCYNCNCARGSVGYCPHEKH